MASREETPSESTSNGTSDERHILSRAERAEIAKILGVSEDEILQEGFRVSRQRMEQLMFGRSEESASTFFDEIMKGTNTVIIWPTRLKPNARSKKDPFIKIRGTANNIEAARMRVVEGLNAKVKHVTLKIDVSYTDHSHIIGRGGNTIKSVMNETGCHIHFPDCNRSNQHEKSNMVSITGETDCIETARSKIRDLVPLVFSFDLPVLGALFMPMDEHNPFITSLKEQYNVQVFFRTRQKLNSTLVLVKGNGTEYERVKEATEKLMSYIRAPRAINKDHVQVHTTIEISPHHHHAVRGKNNCNLNLIKDTTGTQITFPDLCDPNIPSLKMSNVVISGSGISNVYLALQLIIGSLPLAFTFELPEANASANLLKNMGDRFDVFVSTKLRRKSSVHTVTIKGIERNVGNVYEAYRSLMQNGLTPPVQVKIPPSYLLRDALPFTSALYSPQFGDGSSHLVSPLAQSPMPRSPPLLSTTSQITQSSYSQQSTSSSIGGHVSHPQVPMMTEKLSYHHQGYPHQPYSLWPKPYHFSTVPAYVPESELGTFPFPIPALGDVTVHSTPSSNVSNRSPSPETHSPAFSHTPPNGNGYPNVKKRALSPEYDSNLLYDPVKATAIELRKKRPKPCELRIPTNAWAGFGLSHSSPPPSRFSDGKASSDDGQDGQDGEHWRTGASGASSRSTDSLTLSNFLETVGSNVKDTITNAPPTLDLQHLLASIGLEKYYSNFESHEVTELSLFTTLTEPDLLEIGINALGARKKMLMLITELNRRGQNFRATPGAERKRHLQPWWP